MRLGQITIASEILLDLLCFDPKTHRITVVEAELDPREITLVIEGPDMPEFTPPGTAPTVTPVYRRKDWDRIEPPTGA